MRSEVRGGRRERRSGVGPGRVGRGGGVAPVLHLALSVAVLMAASLFGPFRVAAQASRGVVETLQTALDSLVAASGVPGANLGVVLPDGAVLGLSSGMADTMRHLPMRPDVRMLQGSVGKTYFGAVALQLVGEGRLDLDAPVAEYFGDAAWLDRLPNGRRITLRQIMGHTSGLVRYELNPAFLADLTADPMRAYTPQERLAYLFDSEAPFPPGEGWDYSDTNYIVVAMLIERVTGNTAYDEIRRRFLDPLRLSETVPTDSPDVPGLGQGYAGAQNPFGGFDAMVRDGSMVINPQFEWGGGGFASTARDLARWTRHVQEGRAFDAGLMDDYRAGHPAPLGPQASYGLGVIMMTLPGAGRAWGHSGMMPGYLTEAYHFPDHGFTLALQVNSSDFPSLRVRPLRMMAALSSRLAGALGDATDTPGAQALEGSVVTAAGAPAVGAMVTATLTDGRTETVYADGAGRWAFPAGATAGATRLEARLPGVGHAAAPEVAPGATLRLSTADPVLPPGAAWLAGLPTGEESRRFILDCTGCHVTDGTRVELNGMRRDSAAWHGAVAQMAASFGPGTGFPIISRWAEPAKVAGWLARAFREVDPRHAPPVTRPGGALLTEYPVPVPQDLPHDVAVDGNGKVLVTGMFTHRMYVLDPVAGSWDTTPIPVQGANPRAVDVDARGRWWVVLGGPGKVAMYDPADETWRVHDVGMYAHSIALDAGGKAWVNGHFTHQPEVIASVDRGGAIRRYTVPPPDDAAAVESTIPYGLRVARDGTVWGTQLRGNHLVRLDPATGATDQWPMPVSHAGPRRPDVAPDGSVWIPLYSANALARFDPTTETFKVWDFPVAGALPYVARVHQGNGTVWIGTGHGDVAASFDPATERFTLYPLPTRGALVRHLDVDEARNQVWFAYGASPGIPGKVLRLAAIPE